MPIHVLENQNRFILEGKRMAYVFDIGEKGHLIHAYWGKKMAMVEDYCHVNPTIIPHSSFESPRGVMGYDFIPWGEMVYTEPTLKVTAHNGTRSLYLTYSGYKVDDEQLTINLKDERGMLEVSLIYTLHSNFDVIGRKQLVKNIGSEPLVIEEIRSLQTSLIDIDNDLQLKHFTGMWTGEFQLVTEPVQAGKKTLESRRGGTSHQANPWFAIDRQASEDEGEVWYGHFAYSGNWEINVEKDAFGFVQVSGGVQSFDFEWTLNKDESFESPNFYIGYTDKGFGGMSRHAHDFQRQVIMPASHQQDIRKVLYNSWEATYFDVKEEDQKAIAHKAAAMGCELFVVDDGWFGERHSDQAGLGDWVINRKKFPNGLTPLIDHVHGLDMSFGIWVEPEMVNPDSDLYRKHPEWIYHFSDVPSTTSRNQYILNIGRDDVKEYIITFLDELLSNHKIDFVKWDMNRAFSEPGWDSIDQRKQKEIWVRHTESLYEIIDVIRARHPHVLIESCSGGGARIDLGILKRTDQFWTSDNTDAYDRLFIQAGFSYAYNAKAMMCWVTDAPNWLNNRSLPLKFRFHSSMMGSLGIGGNLNEWSEEELTEAKQLVTDYKKIRHLVQDGIQYRIASPEKSSLTAFQYVNKEQTECVLISLFTHRHYGGRNNVMRLKGLVPDDVYEVVGTDIKASGQYFMQFGITWNVSQDYDSQVFHIKKVIN